MKAAFEIALVPCAYEKEMEKYFEENPELTGSSKWEVGKDGPLHIITDLGIENIEELLTHVEKNDPFTAPVMIAVEEMLESHIGNIDTSEDGIDVWKNELEIKLKNADTELKNISLEDLEVLKSIKIE